MSNDSKNYMMGISLGNPVFQTSLFERIFPWLDSLGAERFEMILADKLECINFMVRRRMSLDIAVSAARKRASDLGKIIFATVRGQNVHAVPIIESESVYRNTKLFEDVLAGIKAAYARRGRFCEDINNQVRVNLHALNRDFVDQHIDRLSLYVQEELALFYVYFSLRPDTIEVYPGKNLHVKEAMFRGEYLNELDCRPLSKMPMFIDISRMVPTAERGHHAA